MRGCCLTLFTSIVYNSDDMEADKPAGKNPVRAIETVWLTIIFLIPLFFNPASHQAFYLNKALLFHFLLIVLLATVLAEWIRGGTNFRAWKWQHIVHSPLRISILAFGIIFIVATALSITPKMSFWGSYVRYIGLFTVLCWIMFFLILAHYLRNRAQIVRIIYTLLASSGFKQVCPLS